MCMRTFFQGVRDKYLFSSFIQDTSMFIVLTLTVVNIIMVTTVDEYDASIYRLLLKLAEFTMYISLLWLFIKMVRFTKVAIYKFHTSEGILSTLNDSMYKDTFTKFIMTKLHCKELTGFEKFVLLSRLFTDKCMIPLLTLITMIFIYHSYTDFPMVNEIKASTPSSVIISIERQIYSTICTQLR